MKLWPKRKGVAPQPAVNLIQYIYPIDGSEIKPASIITQVLKDGSVATAKIEALAVTEAKINSLAVTEAKIGALAVTEAKIGALAVTEAKIGAAAVTNAKIGLLAVDTAQIAALAVTDAKINDCSIGKLTVGNLGVAGTIVSGGKFVTGASPNPRIEITDTEITGYSDATTKQFYLQASDGQAYFGGGNCYMNSAGLTIKGDACNYQYTSGAETTTVKMDSNKDFLIQNTGRYISFQTVGDIFTFVNSTSMATIAISADGQLTIGSSAKSLSHLYTYITALKETTTPTAVDSVGKVYTKNTNLLYFQDGAGTEHTVAFA